LQNKAQISRNNSFDSNYAEIGDGAEEINEENEINKENKLNEENEMNEENERNEEIR
jgi:hypothetical protein